MNRPLTETEAKRLDDLSDVWLEGGILGELVPVRIIEKFDKMIGMITFQPTRIYMSCYLWRVYNKYWRLWDKEPTSEEMIGAEWDDDFDWPDLMSGKIEVDADAK